MKTNITGTSKRLTIGRGATLQSLNPAIASVKQGTSTNSISSDFSMGRAFYSDLVGKINSLNTQTLATTPLGSLESLLLGYVVEPIASQEDPVGSVAFTFSTVEFLPNQVFGIEVQSTGYNGTIFFLPSSYEDMVYKANFLFNEVNAGLRLEYDSTAQEMTLNHIIFSSNVLTYAAFLTYDFAKFEYDVTNNCVVLDKPLKTQLQDSTATTPAFGDDSTNVATTAFVVDALQDAIASSVVLSKSYFINYADPDFILSNEAPATPVTLPFDITPGNSVSQVLTYNVSQELLLSKISTYTLWLWTQAGTAGIQYTIEGEVYYINSLSEKVVITTASNIVIGVGSPSLLPIPMNQSQLENNVTLQPGDKFYMEIKFSSNNTINETINITSSAVNPSYLLRAGGEVKTSQVLGTWYGNTRTQEYINNALNPMTSAYDLIIGGVDGLPTKLAKGTSNQIMQMSGDGNSFSWKNLENYIINPMTTPADIIIAGTLGEPLRLAKGLPNTVLKVTEDGSTLEYGTVDPLPNKTGEGSKYLTTDGFTSSWDGIYKHLITVAAAEPESPVSGDSYFNTVTKLLYTYDGTAWSAGTLPLANRLYIPADTSYIYYFNGTTLVQIGGSSEDLNAMVHKTKLTAITDTTDIILDGFVTTENNILNVSIDNQGGIQDTEYSLSPEGNTLILVNPLKPGETIQITFLTTVNISNLPVASETVSGIVKLATEEEVLEGLNNTKAVTPESLRVITSNIPLWSSKSLSYQLSGDNASGWLLQGNKTGLQHTGANQFITNAWGTGTDEIQYGIGDFENVGSIIDNNKQAYSFPSRNCISTIKPFNPGNSNWEIQTIIRTDTVTTGLQDFIGSTTSVDYKIPMCAVRNNKFGIFLSSTGTAWNISPSSGTLGTLTPLPNTDYWIKFGFNGTQYYLDYSLDDTTYVRDITLTSSTIIYQGNDSIIGFGNHVYTPTNSEPWLGSLNLLGTKIIVNNSTWWEPFPNKFPYKLASNGMQIVDSQYKTQVDNLFTSTGSAPFYIRDAVDSTVWSPRQVEREFVYSSTINGTTVRVARDGYCEQSGEYIVSSISQRIGTITLLTPFKNLNYVVTYSKFLNTLNEADYETAFSNKTLQTFQYSLDVGGGAQSYPTTFNWKASGYVSEETLLSLSITPEYKYYKVGDLIKDPQLITTQQALAQIDLLTNTSANIEATNFSTEGKSLLTSFGIPDINRAVPFSSTGSANNPYNFPYPVAVCLTLANSTADINLFISDKNNNYRTVNCGNPGLGSRVSFSWVIPKNTNFYMINILLGGTPNVLSSFYAPLLGVDDI